MPRQELRELLFIEPGTVAAAKYLLGDDQNADYVQCAEGQFQQGLAAGEQHLFQECTILTGGTGQTIGMPSCYCCCSYR